MQIILPKTLHILFGATWEKLFKHLEMYFLSYVANCFVLMISIFDQVVTLIHGSV